MRLPKGECGRDFQTVVLIKVLQSNTKTRCWQAVTASGGFMQPDMELGAPAASGSRGNSVMHFRTAKGHQYLFLSKKKETGNCKYLNYRTINSMSVTLRN